MKKLFIMLTAVLAAGFTGCSYDDSDLWDELKEQDERLTRLEQKVESLNSDIQSIQTIVGVLQSQDMITGVTEISDGYIINFASHSPITIKNGQKGADGTNGTNGTDGTTPVIGVTEEDGIYYWTVNGEFMEDASGNKLPVTGNDGANGTNGTNGQDAIAPQLRINDTTLEWEISVDGGTTWESTGIVAQGSDGQTGPQGPTGPAGADGDSFFSDVNTDNPDYVVFTLSDGTVFEVPRYAVLSLTFTNLRSEVFEIVINESAKALEYTNTGTIAKIGIASAVPAGWNVKVDASNQILVSSTVTGMIDVLIVATTNDGSSASYWVTMSALASAPVTVSTVSGLETALLSISDGGVIDLAPGTYETQNPIIINKDITLRSSDPENTIFTTDGSHSAIQVDASAVTIDGIKIVSEDTSINLALISFVGNVTGSVVQNSIFEGSYDLASGTDGQVVRAILAQAGQGLTIIGNTFLNVRQPAYIEGPATIMNNYTDGTRGWVICHNHDVIMTGNTFGDNAVDIAIIHNNPPADLGYYDDARMLELHNDNDNASINNQIKVGGTAPYISINKDGSTYYQP